MAGLLFIARLVLAGVFLLSGVRKLRSGNLPGQLANYQMVPEHLVRPVAVSLSLLEVVLGALCLAGLLVRFVGIALFGLLLIFSVAIAVNLGRGRSFECGCFGSGSERIGLPVIVRNALLMAVAGLLAVKGSGLDLSATARGWSNVMPALTAPGDLVPLLGTLCLSFTILFAIGSVPARPPRVRPNWTPDGDVKKGLGGAARREAVERL